MDGVNFSLICAVIFRAIKDFPNSEEGNVLGLRFWLCCVGKDILGLSCSRGIFLALIPYRILN